MTDFKYVNPGNREELLEFVSKDFYKKEKLFVKCIKEGVVLPLKRSGPDGPLFGYGGVLDENGNYVIESAQLGNGNTRDRFNGKYEYDRANELYFDETVVYIGAFPEHWGHFLVDMVCRLWYFVENLHMNRIVYCSANQDIDGVYLRFFNLLGIEKDRLMRIKEPSRFRKIIIPQTGYSVSNYFTDEYRSVFRKVISNIPRMDLEPYERIYMSREHLKEAQDKEIGEKNIEFNFKMNGFHVLYMEELSLEEQIFYINNSKIIVALSGTLCHNILFSNNETKLILLNKTHMINNHQVLINQMMNNTVIWIDVYREPYKHFPISYGHGPFLIDSRGLKDFFTDMKWQYYPDKKCFIFLDQLRYIKMCLKIILQQMYVRTYHKVAEHKHIISILRRLKNIIKKSS